MRRAIPLNSPLRAITLIEAILSLSLILLVLSGLTSIISRMPIVMNYFDKKDQALGAALTSLDRIARELRAATVFSSPDRTDRTIVSMLKFEIPNWDKDSLRLPPLPPSDLATEPLWNPRDANYQVVLEFQVVGENLVRAATIGSVRTEDVLLSGCDAFTAQRVSVQAIELRLSLNFQGQLQTLTQSVHLPMSRAWAQ